MGMSEESIAAMKKAAAEGDAHTATLLAHVKEVADREAARRAALGDDTLPEGAFDTKAEAEAYLDQARAAGRFPRVIDDGSGRGDYTVQIDSGFVGHPKVWITAVSDTEWDEVR